MGVADHDLRHEILVAGGHARAAFAAPALRAVGVQSHAFDVSAVGDGHDHIFARDQVFDVVVGLVLLDGGPALVAELFGHCHQLVPYQPHTQVTVGQDFEVLLDLARQLFEFAGNLISLEPGQAGELQREDAARLLLGEIVGAAVADPAPRFVQQLDQRTDVLRRPRALHQLHPRLGRVGGLPDQGNNVVDVGHGDGQPDQNVRPVARLTQLEGHAPGDHFFAEVDEGGNDLLQVQHFRPAAVDRQHVAAEGRLQRRMLEQLVEHHVGLVVALDLDHHAHAVAVGLIVGAGHALDDLVLGELHNALDQSRLVDLIGQLGDHDGFTVLAVFLNVGLGADHDRPATGVVGIADAASAKDHRPGREVWPGQVLHQVIDGQAGIVDVGRARGDHFGQVMGRNVGRHAHGDTAGAIDQQVGVGRGQNLRLLPAFVVVGLEIDGVFVDVFEQARPKLGQPRLGIAISSGRVAVHGTEVALPVDQHGAHRERLRHAHHGVVDRAVAVGVVATHDLAHEVCGLAVGAVPLIAASLGSVENAAVDRFQAVADIGQGARDDDRHGVVQIGLAHLGNQRHRRDVVGQCVEARPVVTTPVVATIRTATQAGFGFGWQIVFAVGHSLLRGRNPAVFTPRITGPQSTELKYTSDPKKGALNLENYAIAGKENRDISSCFAAVLRTPF